MNKLILSVLSGLWAVAIAGMPVQAIAGNILNTETAIFAGGCFWCTESDFDKVKGVLVTTSGYIGGHENNPTYREVSAGGTGHAEAVKIEYDPQQVSYAELVKGASGDRDHSGKHVLSRRRLSPGLSS